MNAGEISHNTAHFAGGVFVYDGTFTMNAGEISWNTASDYDAGGGVLVGGIGNFTLENGIISHNTAGDGGGVAVYDDGTFTMNGGEILGNTAANYGGGVAGFGGTFTISGGARVNADNPVGLICFDPDSLGIFSTVLTIGGGFTGPAGIVATIDLFSFTDQASSNSPPAYDWPGRAVLTLDPSYSGDLSALKNRFTLGNFVYMDSASSNPPTSTPITGYVIGTDGTLQ
jgi:hypothetical protein